MDAKIRAAWYRTFSRRMTALLSRCDKPGELFSVISRERFLESWPRILAYWMKRAGPSEARDGWETLYEQLVAERTRKAVHLRGGRRSS